MSLLSRAWPAALVLGLASLLLYSINIGHAPHPDELYHVLAAEGLLETGEPAIGEDGRYWRGYPLTWLVAQSFALLGPSVAVARLPAMLFMGGLVVLLFLFLHRHAGAAAAWIGAGLFAISPFAIELAQFVRFYSLQALIFFAAAWMVYALLERPRPLVDRLSLSAMALFLLGLASYLQPTTLLGIVGLGLWASGALLLPWLADATVPVRAKWRLLLGLAVAGLAVLALLWASGSLGELWRDYRSTSLTNRPHADQFWFYHAWYSLLYPTLWTLSGVLAVVALIARPRLASLVVTVFAVGFLLNSFAASKNMRYIAYAQPFLFALWGVGLAALLGHARNVAVRSRERLAARLALLPRFFSRSLANLLVVAALTFLVIANPAVLRSATLLAGIAVPPELPSNDWRAARPVLAPWIDEVEAVVTTNELQMLHYYGRADYLLSASKFGELPAARRQPFGRDARTDVPVIKEAGSLELIMACHASGLFVTQTQHWLGGARERSEVAGVATLLDNRARRLELPERSRLVAFVWQEGTGVWQEGTGAPRPAACDALPQERR